MKECNCSPLDRGKKFCDGCRPMYDLLRGNIATKSKEQILKAAIEQAVKNGYVLDEEFKVGQYHDGECCIDIDIMDAEGYAEYDLENVIIFDHDFARAFFGEEMGEYLQAWQHHLQEMVLEEDRIKYLEQFLNEDLNSSK